MSLLNTRNWRLRPPCGPQIHENFTPGFITHRDSHLLLSPTYTHLHPLHTMPHIGSALQALYQPESTSSSTSTCPWYEQPLDPQTIQAALYTTDIHAGMPVKLAPAETLASIASYVQSPTPSIPRTSRHTSTASTPAVVAARRALRALPHALKPSPLEAWAYSVGAQGRRAGVTACFSATQQLMAWAAARQHVRIIATAPGTLQLNEPLVLVRGWLRAADSSGGCLLVGASTCAMHDPSKLFGTAAMLVLPARRVVSVAKDGPDLEHTSRQLPTQVLAALTS